MTRDGRKLGYGLAAVGLTLWLGATGTGCRLVQGAADLPGDAMRVVTPGKAKHSATDLAELQQQLFRFTDQYLARVLAAVDELEAVDPQMTREMAQRVRVGYAGDLWTAAAGPNTYADLLDLVTITTLARMVIEEYWIPEIFGDSAKQLLEVTRTGEEEIWAIAAIVLSANEQEELRKAIQVWREQNPDAVHAMYVRAVGLAGRMAKSSSHDREGPTSVFRLLMIDPLSGLDPAARELTQTRLAAERALYVAQRMPFMLRWQAELWTSHLADMTETRQLLTNSTKVADAVARLSRTVEELPDQVRQERTEIVKALRSEQQNLRELTAEVQGTLITGSQTASNVTVALERFDAVVQRLQSSGSESAAEPFRIRDYTEAAVQLDVAAQHLSDLMQQLDSTLASTGLQELVDDVAPVMEGVESSGRDLVDHAFRRLLLLLVIACGLFLITAALHRRFAGGTGGSTRQ